MSNIICCVVCFAESHDGIDSDVKFRSTAEQLRVPMSLRICELCWYSAVCSSPIVVTVRFLRMLSTQAIRKGGAQPLPTVCPIHSCHTSTTSSERGAAELSARD